MDDSEEYYDDESGMESVSTTISGAASTMAGDSIFSGAKCVSIRHVR